MMLLSCIIPAHNEEALVGSCIDSVIQNSNGHLLEVIVVDNASDDRTSQIAAQRKGVKVIYEERKGLAYARERGRQAAMGDLIAFIDADSRMPPGWMDFADWYLQQNGDVVCLSGPPIYYDTSPRNRLLLGVLWRVFAPVAYRIVGYMVYGAHFVVRRQALDAIGGFNCTIDFYGEDTSLARRLRSRGKVAFCMTFRILTSARRFHAQGLLSTSVRYALNFLWPVMFDRPFSMNHVDVR